VKSNSRDASDRKMNVVLWIIQVLLAIVFLFAGASKLIMSVEEMTKQIQMPGLFLRFIGVCEILGAFGLILPGLLRIRPELTPLAAAGLAIITAGATVVTLVGGLGAVAVIPFVVASLSGFVAYRRRQMTPHRAATRGSA
jgi:uncharacterized membrane protein YphA (DoxX/SURF4 family)